MAPQRYPDESWQLFCPRSILALLNARLTLTVGCADRAHYDALADEYGDAAFFAPPREAPAAARATAPSDGRASDR